MGALLLEMALAWRADRPGTAALFGLALAATVATQVTFLALGATMTRTWDATEAREWLIAAALALYALQFASAPEARVAAPGRPPAAQAGRA